MFTRAVRSQSKRALSICTRLPILHRALTISHPRASSYSHIPYTAFPQSPLPKPRPFNKPSHILTINGPEVSQHQVVKRVERLKKEGFDPISVYYRRQGQIAYVQFEDQNIASNALQFAQTVLWRSSNVQAIKLIHNERRGVKSTLMIVGPDETEVGKIFRDFPVFSIQFRRKLETYVKVTYADVDTATRAREKLLEVIPCREIVFGPPIDDQEPKRKPSIPQSSSRPPRTSLLRLRGIASHLILPTADNAMTPEESLETSAQGSREPSSHLDTTSSDSNPLLRLRKNPSPHIDESTPENTTPLLLHRGLSSHFTAPVPDSPITPQESSESSIQGAGEHTSHLETTPSNPDAQLRRLDASAHDNTTRLLRRSGLSSPFTASMSDNNRAPEASSEPTPQYFREPPSHPDTTSFSSNLPRRDPWPRLDTSSPDDSQLSRDHLESTEFSWTPQPQRTRDPLPHLDLDTSSPNSQPRRDPLPHLDTPEDAGTKSSWQPLPPVYLKSGSPLLKYQVPSRYRAHLINFKR